MKLHNYYYRISESVHSVDSGRNSTIDVPIRSNQRYLKESDSAANSTRGACSLAVTINHPEGGAGPDYSSFGPDYETIDSSREQPQRGNLMLAGQPPERYEYSEAHLNQNVPAEGLGSANYEVPLNLRQNVSTESDEYSHLKH